ncbi:hypothetical protein GGX14DRAFT_564936 [Mycena pura]|uniref:F-box domain-containing protein n=1 Tax=Mycena pura TaxID=153505 RepID=A0AAD6YBF2_9AGAR|nr:hypothetical protein GGX14DRAFT_564936 [Mycena pura]
MLRSFIRRLSCTTPSSADYDLLPDTAAVTSAPPPLGPITRLPPELVHLVFTFIDPSTLAACSLVCAGWLPHARRRMFSRVSISLHNAHRFGRLLAAAPPRALASFPAHVRAIELDDRIADDFWAAEVLPKYVAHFERLTTLCFFGALPRALPRAFAAVTHLELNYVYTSLPRRLEAFIASLPRLETLKVTQEKGPYFPVSGEYRPSSALRRVDLDDPSLLHWIITSHPSPKLEAIQLEISRPETLVMLESLRRLSSLESLDLILTDLEVGASFLTKKYLSSTTQLRSLRIQADHSHAAHILLHLLSYIDTARLASLSLDFAIPYLSELDGPAVLTLLPWDALDAALARLPALRRLAVVKVFVSPPGWRSRVSQRAVLLDAADRMPRCRGRCGPDPLPPERPPSPAAGSPRFCDDLYEL